MMEPPVVAPSNSKNDLGLLVLWPPPSSTGQLPAAVDEPLPDKDDAKPAFDIVAVHGLNGHRTESWTSISSTSGGQAHDQGGEKILWLRDILPSLVRGAQVMTFGWDWKANSTTTTSTHGSHKADRLTSRLPAPTSACGIRQVAIQLLDELIKNTKYSTVPLIFVCHSFGGIIIKELLAIANNNEAYLSIAERTKLLIFFGTPHRPSSTSSWEDLLFDIALSSTRQLPTWRRELLESVVQTGMADVANTTKSFRVLSTQYQILNFYEREKEGFMEKVIVPEPSACMAVAQEKCLARGGSSTHLTLHHFFPGNKNDETQLNLIAMFCRRSAGGGKLRDRFTVEELRESLACHHRFLRWSQPRPVATAQSYIHRARSRGRLQGTLSWLYRGRSQLAERTAVGMEENLDTLQFTNLLCNNGATAGPTLLHVTGRAGTGKTVLAAYLCDTLSQNFVAESMLGLEEAPYSLDADSPIILSFFFSACDIRRQSPRDMLVSLLAQLLSYGPEVYRSIRRQYLALERRYGNSDLYIGWTDEDLWCLLRAIIACRELPQVVCIVDAIDEGKDHNNYRHGHGNPMKLLELVDKIIKLRKQTDKPFKFVFTTRGPHFGSGVTSRLSESVALLADACAGKHGASVNLDSNEEARLDKDMFISVRVAVMAEEDLLATARLNELLASRTLLELDLLLPSHSAHVPIGLCYRNPQIPLTMALANELSSLGDSAYIDSICDYILSAIAMEHRMWAHEVLSWLLFATRPLRIDELSVFLSVAKGGQSQHKPQSVFQGRFFEDMRTALYHAFGPLIIIDEDCNSSGGIRSDEYAATGAYINFRHPAIKDYLLHRGDDAAGDLFCYTNKPRWHKELAMRCLTYLRDHFRENPKSPYRRTVGDPDSDFTQKSEPQTARQMDKGAMASHEVGAEASVHSHGNHLRRQVAALAYATRYWPLHYKEAMSSGWGDPGTLKLIDLTLEVIGSEWRSAPGLTSWWAEWYIYPDHRSLPGDSLLGDGNLWNSAVSIAAHLGLVGICTMCNQNPNNTQSCVSVLPLAAVSGQVCVVQEILGFRDIGVGSEPAAHDLEGRNGSVGSASNICRGVMVDTLQKACKAGHREIVALVLHALKDEDKKALGPEEVGFSLPLDQCLAEAASRGHTEVVQILLAENPDINKMVGIPASRLPKSSIYRYRRYRLSTDSAPLHYAPLHWAAINGYDSVVAVLLAANADISLPACSLLPLHYAAEQGHFVLVQLLLSEGADVDTKWVTKPLHLAAGNGHLASVRELLKKDPKLDTTDSSGLSALHNAIYGSHLLVVRELLNAGADISTLTATSRYFSHMGSTPLYLACALEYVSIVELLLESGADPDAISEDRKRPLHIAVQYNNELIVRMLLENGAFADPTTRNKKKTPLHFACKHSVSVHIIQLLLEYDADLKKNTASGEAPLSIAVRYGHVAAFKYLMEHGADPYEPPESITRLLFTAAATNSGASAEILKILLEKCKVEAVEIKDSWGRTLLDVALAPSVRELLIPPEHQKEDLARNTCRHYDGRVNTLTFSCNLCNRKALGGFWFHCCTCKDATCYDICQDCNRCDGGEDHKNNWVVLCIPEGASASLSTLSPWVKTMRYPDPTDSDA